MVSSRICSSPRETASSAPPLFTPIQLLQNNWGSVFTVPQTTYNKMAMVSWTGSYAYSPTLSFQGGAYFRAFNQQHVDGNPTDVSPARRSRA